MPTGYHKHATPSHQRIAENGTIFRCVVGSTVHGISVKAQDDRDEMGICVEPREYVIGLQRFEQYITRTQPEGHRSGPGDLDLTIYCHNPASKVLTAQLDWAAIGDLTVGQHLVTFDEGSPSRRRHRHFSTGIVTAIETRIMERWRVVTSQGETIVTPGHLFFVRRECQCKTCRANNTRRARWLRADELQSGDAIYSLPVWESERSWESGYLAGQFDADGCLNFTGSTSRLSWAQKAGRPDIPYVEQLMAGRGFKTRTNGPTRSGCSAVHVAGDWTEQMRFLGTVQPQRLLRHPELNRLWEARSLQACGRATVQETAPLPDGPMVAMETSTRTYIADGLLTHNSARKWMNLALAGNPTILLPLFVPDDAILVLHPVAKELLAHPEMIISRQVGERFLGYLNRQRLSLLSRDGKGRDVTRAELVEQYGFDTKFAGHMVRLGLQGVELMETGRITLPVPEPWRTWITDLRVGKHTQAEALEVTVSLEEALKRLRITSELPERPDREAADRWLISTYETLWAQG